MGAADHGRHRPLVQASGRRLPLRFAMLLRACRPQRSSPEGQEKQRRRRGSRRPARSRSCTSSESAQRPRHAGRKARPPLRISVCLINRRSALVRFAANSCPTASPPLCAPQSTWIKALGSAANGRPDIFPICTVFIEHDASPRHHRIPAFSAKRHMYGL